MLIYSDCHLMNIKISSLDMTITRNWNWKCYLLYESLMLDQLLDLQQNILIVQGLSQHGCQGCLAPADFGNFTTYCCVAPLNFEDFLLIGTRCFKLPTQALYLVALEIPFQFTKIEISCIPNCIDLTSFLIQLDKFFSKNVKFSYEIGILSENLSNHNV